MISGLRGQKLRLQKSYFYLYINIIRKAVDEEGIFLANIEKSFDGFLKDKVQTNYLIENFWAVTFTDRIVSLNENCLIYDVKTLVMFNRRWCT